jgi:ATP-binding cassette, subfamily B, bacterial
LPFLGGKKSQLPALREAQILILDEPTSALDAKAEFEIFKQYHQLTKDRTAIL